MFALDDISEKLNGDPVFQAASGCDLGWIKTSKKGGDEC
jgi:hypothetical protein